MGKAARGLEPRFHIDDDVLALGRERVFGRSWVPVCRLEDVARPGDHLTYDLAGDPIVVARTRDGRLSAMANVCRHRSMVIMTAAGNASALQCPYHLWTYSLSRADDREFIDRQLDAVRAVNTEDIVPNAGVSSGLRRRYAVAATLHPLGAAIDHFSRWYRNRMCFDASG